LVLDTCMSKEQAFVQGEMCTKSWQQLIINHVRIKVMVGW